MESAMVLLLLILVGILTYMLFSPKSIIGPWLDKYCQDEKERWMGEDVGPIMPKTTTKKSTKRKSKPKVAPVKRKTRKSTKRSKTP